MSSNKGGEFIGRSQELGFRRKVDLIFIWLVSLDRKVCLISSGAMRSIALSRVMKNKPAGIARAGRKGLCPF